MRSYITRQGDMWDSIAYSQLGDEAYTDKIINLNQRYRNNYSFPAGIKLLLPDTVENVSDSVPPWKKVTG